MSDTSFTRPDGATVAKSASFPASFRFAVKGIGRAWQTETNLRLQFMLCVLMLLLALALDLPATQVAILVGAAALVFAFELINSAVEALADAIHPAHNAGIAAAKDMAAGAVLAASLGAAAAGLLILGPPLFNWLVR